MATRPLYTSRAIFYLHRCVSSRLYHRWQKQWQRVRQRVLLLDRRINSYRHSSTIFVRTWTRGLETEEPLSIEPRCGDEMQ